MPAKKRPAVPADPLNDPVQPVTNRNPPQVVALEFAKLIVCPPVPNANVELALTVSVPKVSAKPAAAPVLNVPPASTMLLELLITLAAPKRKIPATIDVLPVYVLAPERVSVPVPCFETVAPAPEMKDVTLVAPLPSKTTVLALPKISRTKLVVAPEVSVRSVTDVASMPMRTLKLCVTPEFELLYNPLVKLIPRVTSSGDPLKVRLFVAAFVNVNDLNPQNAVFNDIVV